MPPMMITTSIRAGIARNVVRTISASAGLGSLARYPRWRQTYQLAAQSIAVITSPGMIPAMNSPPTETSLTCMA